MRTLRNTGLAFIQSILNGLALLILWGWFVVPLGVPELRLWQSVGICSLMGVVTWTLYTRVVLFEGKFDRVFKQSQPDEYKLAKYEAEIQQHVYGFLMPPLAVAFGALYHVLDVGHL